MWCSGDSLESKRRRSEIYSTEITGTHNYGGKNNEVTILSFNKTKLKDVISTYLKTKLNGTLNIALKQNYLHSVSFF